MSSDVPDKQLSVLVVAEHDQETTSDLLAALGHTVLEQPKGESLSDYCRNVGPVPDLVVTDMVNRQAIELAVKAFRNRELRVPFVLIVENGNVSELLACREIDTALHYCLKPLDPGRMETAILWAVKEQETREKVLTTEGLLDDRTFIDRAERILIAGRAPMYEKEAHRWLRDCTASRQLTLAEYARRLVEANELFFPRPSAPPDKEE